MTMEYEEAENTAAAPSKRRKISVPMQLAKGVTSATSKPRGSLSLKQCYERMDKAIELQRLEGYPYIREEAVGDIEEEEMEVYRKMCRMFKEVWFAATLLDDRLHSLSKPAKANLSAPLFLALLAFIHAVALHKLANFAAILSEVDNAPTPESRYPTSFVTGKPKFDLGGTDDSQDFLEAAMIYYEAAASELEVFKNQDPAPRHNNTECFELLFSTGQIQCRCEMNLRNRRFEPSELPEVARYYTESFFESVKSFLESVPALMEDLPPLRTVCSLLDFFPRESYYTLFDSLISTISEITRQLEYKYQNETIKDYSYPQAVLSSIQPIMDQLSPYGRVREHRRLISAQVKLAHLKISQESVVQNYKCVERVLSAEELWGQIIRKDQYGVQIKELQDVQEVRDAKYLGKRVIEQLRFLIDLESMYRPPRNEELLALYKDLVDAYRLNDYLIDSRLLEELEENQDNLSRYKYIWDKLVITIRLERVASLKR